VNFSISRADGFHLLRHTSRSAIYRRSGGELKVAQEWLRDSSSRIAADMYVHLQKEHQRAAPEALSRGMFSQPSVQSKGQPN
jgi:integrase